MNDRPSIRSEDLRLVTGAGCYTADVPHSGMLHACFLRSDRPHAAITAMDISDALASPGVVGVLTGADVAALKSLPSVMPFRGRDGFPFFHPHRPALAQGCVRYVGEPVALVLAETVAQAQDGAEAIFVDYEDLPFVVDAMDALQAAAPLVHEGREDNRCFEWETGDAGATAEAFARAATVTEIVVRIPRMAGNPMEPSGCIASVEPATGRVRLTCGSQGAAAMQGQLCSALGMAAEQVRVLTHDVGGAFGVKAHAFPEYLATIEAARRFHRPVRWVCARGEAFLSEPHGRDSVFRARLAMDAEGRFLGMEFRITANMGAYLTMNGALIMTKNTGQAMAGVYRTPAIHGSVTCVLTHTVPVGPYRGAGRPEMAYAIEHLIDAAALQTGIDRAELRRRNLIRTADMPYRTPTGAVYDSGDFPAVLDRALALSDWEGFAMRRAQSARAGRLRGIGIATFLEGTGAAPRERVRLSTGEAGTVEAHCGTQSTGQGHETVFASMAAERLGVMPSSVCIRQGDSSRIPGGAASVASRSLHATGSALLAAVEAYIARGRALAARALGVDEAQVGFTDGEYRSGDRGIAILALGASLNPQEREGWTAMADVEVQPTFPNGCHVAEVEIDPDTGSTTICDYSCVDDFGVVASPMIVEGQLQGGIAQGAGEALLEAVTYDRDSGQLLTGSLVDYAMPAADLLPSIRAEFLPVPCKTNATGGKGAGEAGTTGAVCALMSAVVDAVGGAPVRMPATPAAVREVLQQGRG